MDWSFTDEQKELRRTAKRFVDEELRERVRLFVNVRNLTNRRYVAARRPAGARPGPPRTFFAGVKLRLGPSGSLTPSNGQLLHD